MRVRVLVSVQMRGRNPGGDDALDLSAEFALDVGFLNHAAPEAAGQLKERLG